MAVLAVESKGDAKGAARLFEEEGYTFPYVHDTKSVHKNLYKVRAFPTTYLISRAGLVQYKHVGFSEGMDKILEEEIVELLAEPELPVKQ